MAAHPVFNHRSRRICRIKKAGIPDQEAGLEQLLECLTDGQETEAVKLSWVTVSSYKPEYEELARDICYSNDLLERIFTCKFEDRLIVVWCFIYPLNAAKFKKRFADFIKTACPERLNFRKHSATKEKVVSFMRGGVIITDSKGVNYRLTLNDTFRRYDAYDRFFLPSASDSDNE